MKFRADHSKSPLLLVDICEIDDRDPQENKPSVYLKGSFAKFGNFSKETKYRLYKRYYDFNLNRVLNTLTKMDERNDNESLFMVNFSLLFEVFLQKK